MLEPIYVKTVVRPLLSRKYMLLLLFFPLANTGLSFETCIHLSLTLSSSHWCSWGPFLHSHMQISMMSSTQLESSSNRLTHPIALGHLTKVICECSPVQNHGVFAVPRVRQEGKEAPWGLQADSLIPH